jgi:ACT domain-containing protein
VAVGGAAETKIIEKIERMQEIRKTQVVDLKFIFALF